MTRRLFAALSLAACVVGGVGALTSPAAADDEYGSICIGGDNQRKPGHNQGICLIREDTIRLGND